MNINTVTFAARDFAVRRGANDEHIPQWICEERATKTGRKRPGALRVAPNLACGVVARQLQPPRGDAPSSRLATAQIGRNERHRNYVHDHSAICHQWRPFVTPYRVEGDVGTAPTRMNEQIMKSQPQCNQSATLDAMPYRRCFVPELATTEPVRNIFAFIFAPLTEKGVLLAVIHSRGTLIPRARRQSGARPQCIKMNILTTCYRFGPLCGPYT